MQESATPRAADFAAALEQLTTARTPAMREVFSLAKTLVDMPLTDVRQLLASEEHLHRVGAVSIMDFRARRRRVTEEERAALYRLYVDEHDLIDTWDLVDRAAPHVVGGYLHDRDRAPLYELARSSDPWRRRTSVVATWYFIRVGDLDDTFALAELLAHDPEEVVQAAVGGFVREAGKRDPDRLRGYLDRHLPGLPTTILRHAIRHLPGGRAPAIPGSRQVGMSSGRRGRTARRAPARTQRDASVLRRRPCRRRHDPESNMCSIAAR